MGALWSEDYEKVFGKPTKWSLFSEDEEAYEAFRQTIIDSPHYVYDKSKLPFAGVKVYGYDLYLLKLNIDQKEAEGKKLFYIKDETPGLAKVLAFGYFDYRKETFYLIANSLIRKTKFQEKMRRHQALNMLVNHLNAQSEIRKCDAAGQDEHDHSKQLELFHLDGYRIKQDVGCSASVAAAYALGQEADFTKWKGMSGKTLAETYTFYQDNSKLSEIKSIWESLRKLKEEPSFADIFNRVLKQMDEYPIIEWPSKKHLLLDNIITPLIQHKEKETATIVTPKRKELSVILCYLIDEEHSEKYFAKGCYYAKEKTIKVFAGAVFSLEVSSSLRYSAADYKRRTFIKEYCSTRKSKYTLKEDYCFDSIDTAAMFIMGQIADGLSVWIGKDNKTLGEIINEAIH